MTDDRIHNGGPAEDMSITYTKTSRLRMATHLQNPEQSGNFTSKLWFACDELPQLRSSQNKHLLLRKVDMHKMVCK